MFQNQMLNRVATRRTLTLNNFGRFFSTTDKGYVTDRAELPLKTLPTIAERRPYKM